MAVHHTCSYTKNFPHFLFFFSMLVIKKDFIHVILQDETVSLACLIILFITSKCIPKKQKNTKPRIHIKFKTHSQIYLFFSLSKSKEMQASSYRETIGGAFSDIGFQIWGSLQFQIPIGPHSQEASLCHIEVPMTMEEYMYISAQFITGSTAYDPAKIMHTNLMSLCCILKVGSFNNSINRASLLAESTINALCHVNIIPGKVYIWDREKEETERDDKGEGARSFT